MSNSFVKKEQLNGFRAPTVDENVGIARYMSNTLNKKNKRLIIFRNICILFGLVFVLGICGITVDDGISQRLWYLACAIGCFAFALINNAIIKDNKTILSGVTDGKYTVMDCLVYKVDLAADVANDAVVYIMNKNGQYCDERFLIDYYSAKECKTNKGVPFVLARIEYKKGMMYELFSNKKMGR